MSDIFIGMLFMDVHGDVSENLENLNLSWKSVFLNVFDRIVGELPKNMTHTHTCKCIDTAQVKAIHTFQSFSQLFYGRNVRMPHYNSVDAGKSILPMAFLQPKTRRLMTSSSRLVFEKN